MKDSILFTAERQSKILELIRKNGSVSVNYLAEFFNVSATTIRMDLTSLEAEGEISRTHGGAILRSVLHREPRMNERFNDDKKQLIALRAVSMIKENDTLLLDTGTTVLYLAKALVSCPIKRLVIYTNDIDVMRVLEEKDGFELHLFPGRMRNGFHYSYGSQMIAQLRDCHFDKLFLAVSALSLSEGLTTENVDLAALKEEMIKASEKVILLVDSSKFGLVNFKRFASLRDVDAVITDSGISAEDERALERMVKSVSVVTDGKE